MWFNEDNIYEKTEIFTEEEIKIIKQLFSVYKEEINVLFNDTIEENETKIRMYKPEHIHYKLLKAVIFMKKNWANNINDLKILYEKQVTSTNKNNDVKIHTIIEEIKTKTSLQ